MRDVNDGTLAAYTTIRLGGPADRIVEAYHAEEIVQVLRDATRDGTPVLVLAGGSNLVVADDGFPGTVLVIRSSGVTVEHRDGGVELTVAAGHPWDDLVARAVAEGWSGVECLSGIPGSAGATPIQNVGAYGQEVSETITAVRVYDRRRDAVVTMRPGDCGFGYRSSVFRGRDRWVVLDVRYRLDGTGLSRPVRYPELARALGVELGGAVPLAEVREAVLGLRRRKGMVLDATDPDTSSVGSFFVNPVLDRPSFHALRRRCAELLGEDTEPPSWPGGDGRVKTSAAWLIERAGFARGYGRDGVAISSKHTLALTNRGTGTTKALLDLAAEIRDGVRERFGVALRPEPVLVGVTL